MKKILMYSLSIILVGCLTLLFFEYQKYSDVKAKLGDIKTEINDVYNNLFDATENISNLKLEEQTLKMEKSKQIEQYEKWIRHNQILEDLLN